MTDQIISQQSDFSDPASWKLVVCITDCSLQGWLRNVVDTTVPLRLLADRKWNGSQDDLLGKIENAVYDNPSLLDDYSSEIVVCSQKSLCLPAEVMAEESDVAELFGTVFAGSQEDDLVMASTGGVGFVSWLTSGLGAFLRRTFPGAKVYPHLAKLHERLHSRNEGPAVYADLSGGYADILVYDDQRLLLAARHRYSDTVQAQYHILNCASQAGLQLDKTQAFLSGARDEKGLLLRELRNQLPMVRNTLVPNLYGNEDLPLAVLACMNPVSKHKKY